MQSEAHLRIQLGAASAAYALPREDHCQGDGGGNTFIYSQQINFFLCFGCGIGTPPSAQSADLEREVFANS
jgi:hypothetical protein